MRLLDVQNLRVVYFMGDDVPEYAILSHTWEKEEVTFQDMEDGAGGKRAKAKAASYHKIVGCCKMAAAENIEWAWVDTCCIDKTDSSELTEAIASMFRWYANSKVCYAYLSDLEGTPVSGSTDSRPVSIDKESLAKSRWFTRGWTLQELMAPRSVIFTDKHWQVFGSKTELAPLIQEVTGIHPNALAGDVDLFCAAQKFSWAAHRKTARREDQAYCLMGLFDVNMPLLYGEGDKAFLRLQQEIIGQTDDESIFAWKSSYDKETSGRAMTEQGLFANSAYDFRYSGNITVNSNSGKRTPFARMVLSHWPESYMNPFEINRNKVRIRQPSVGPIVAIYMEDAGSEIIPGLIRVKGLLFGDLAAQEGDKWEENKWEGDKWEGNKWAVSPSWETGKLYYSKTDMFQRLPELDWAKDVKSFGKTPNVLLPCLDMPPQLLKGDIPPALQAKSGMYAMRNTLLCGQVRSGWYTNFLVKYFLIPLQCYVHGRNLWILMCDTDGPGSPLQRLQIVSADTAFLSIPEPKKSLYTYTKLPATISNVRSTPPPQQIFRLSISTLLASGYASIMPTWSQEREGVVDIQAVPNDSNFVIFAPQHVVAENKSILPGDLRVLMPSTQPSSASPEKPGKSTRANDNSILGVFLRRGDGEDRSQNLRYSTFTDLISALQFFGPYFIGIGTSASSFGTVPNRGRFCSLGPKYVVFVKTETHGDSIDVALSLRRREPGRGEKKEKGKGSGNGTEKIVHV